MRLPSVHKQKSTGTVVLIIVQYKVRNNARVGSNLKFNKRNQDCIAV